jgi:hypothetical protein
MARTKRLSPQDLMMRADGYVTAVEISEATGLALSAIHKGIDAGRIAGKSVEVSARYKHRYVQLDAYVKEGAYAPTPMVKENLARLTTAVVAAKRAKPGASIPRPAP